MNVLLIDDDKLVCSSLQIILSAESGITVTGTGYSGEDATSLYDALLPDILLMDIRMEPVSGLSAGETILTQHPDAKILYLTTFLDDDYIIKALNIGAMGYMLKQDFESIVPALRAVSSGQHVYGKEIVSKLPHLLSSHTNQKPYEKAGITSKEMELITQISEGKSNKEIAMEFFLSEGTIRNYISTILEKLELRDRTQIAVFYYKNKN